MPCGCHWSRNWWSTVSEGPDLGGSDCGQQWVSLSVCIITHFLHEVIYLDTTGQRDTRGLTAQVSSYITTHSGCDGLWTCGDFAVNTAKTWTQVNVYCAVIRKRCNATGDNESKRKQELQNVRQHGPTVVAVSHLWIVRSDCMLTK